MKCCGKDIKKLPVITKCCFCVPIRKGVIIFGYFNLVLSLLSFPLLIFLLVEELTGKPVYDKDHPNPLVHLPVTIAFVVVDVLMTIVLLIGAHKSFVGRIALRKFCLCLCLLYIEVVAEITFVLKKRLLLQVYFYFGIIFQMLTLCLDFIYFDHREYIENTIYFFFLGLNIYLLFLVYNILLILQENRDVQYVSYRENQLIL